MNHLTLPRRRPRHRAALATAAVAAALALTACGNAASPGQAAPSTTAGHGAEDHDHDHDAGSATEAAAATPRLTVTYDGGVLVLDANTLATEADLPVAGYPRVSPAGDERHVVVATQGGFALLDAGAWSKAHGDHSHHFTGTPALTDVLVKAAEPGHVVVHDGATALFDDATGTAVVVPADGWTEAAAHGHVHPLRTWTAPAPHHGVAVPLTDETGGIALAVSVGTDEKRTGGAIIAADDTEVIASDQCPGVHGEATLHGADPESDGGDVVVLGCEDGALVLHGDHAHKLTAPDAYGRIGNLRAAPGSAVVLGDYKTDPKGALTHVSLIDPAAETIAVVDPFDGSGANYTFRGLARGDDGEALVLGTDGTLRVLDPATGALVRSIPVTQPWEAPAEWQTAHPSLLVLAGMAYVTDPATKTIHVVDYAGGKVWKSETVPHAPIEIAGVEG